MQTFEVSIAVWSMGHNASSLAAALGVNPRTVRAWISGRDRVSDRATAMIQAERAYHAAAVAEAVNRGDITLPKRERDGRPRSWWVAVAAHAAARDPHVVIRDAQ